MPMRKWRVDDSAELYNIRGWGRNYFDINDKGNVTVTPRPGDFPVDLKELMDRLQERDLASPILLRFPDILDNHRNKELAHGCLRAMPKRQVDKLAMFMQ